MGIWLGQSLHLVASAIGCTVTRNRPFIALPSMRRFCSRFGLNDFRSQFERRVSVRMWFSETSAKTRWAAKSIVLDRGHIPRAGYKGSIRAELLPENSPQKRLIDGRRSDERAKCTYGNGIRDHASPEDISSPNSATRLKHLECAAEDSAKDLIWD